ncbi:uncharacterized protein MAM_06627 [Metarhizium album ARSEF 1941]|uniref:Uncharacterized protein n=1 Tax=Metarhizium album (strain ARSEF 1941) TaxID=1081103 RepID=A0A0B2WRG3_METAS|nr:uncharacterized protein MAM_06627 [Metarhizium album ARSEF 1941]KHN95570.1 hypothetical protein MAM_06627 [Metarhizium album ARSEF 1941]
MTDDVMLTPWTVSHRQEVPQLVQFPRQVPSIRLGDHLVASNRHGATRYHRPPGPGVAPLRRT